MLLVVLPGVKLKYIGKHGIVFLLKSMHLFKSKIVHVIFSGERRSFWQYIIFLILGLKVDRKFSLKLILLTGDGPYLDWCMGTQQVLKSGHTFVLSPSVPTIPNVHKLIVWIIEFYSHLTIYTDSLQFAEPVRECNRYCQFRSKR